MTTHAETLQATEFIRFSKYLIPKSYRELSCGSRRVPAQVLTLEELQLKHPQQVQLRSVGGSSVAERSHSRSTQGQSNQCFQVIENGNAIQRFCTTTEAKPSVVASIEGGESIGRECLIVSPFGEQVFEFGFSFDTEHLASKLLLGRWSPNFKKRRRQGDLRQRKVLPVEQELSGSVAAINKNGAHCFYHWLVEVAPRIMAIRMAGFAPDYFVVDCQSRYQREVLELLGVGSHQLVQPHCALRLRCEQLLCVPQCGIEVVKQFVASMKSQLKLPESNAERIYISRRKARNRRIANELHIEELLRSRGFRTVCLEQLSIAEQVGALHHASEIVAVHGSGLANTIFAEAGAGIVEIFPACRKNIDLYPQQSVDFGHQHVSVLSPSGFTGQIRVQPNDLELALEMVASNKRMFTEKAA